MKTKNTTHFSKILLLVGLLVLVGSKGWGQTILNFPLTANNQPTTYSVGNSGCRISTVSTGAVTYGTTNGAQASGWDGGSGTKCWYTSTFNSTDLKTLTVNFFIRSASGAPRDFSLQYSLNNSTWVPISAITATNTLTQTSNIALPEACSNQSNLYLRIIMTSNTPISGTGSVTAAAISYLKGFTVNGVSPSRPGGQAANITFIAITPTTIKVGCSPGNGDHRIIVMNTSESFTNPADNSTQTANSTYTSGEKVVYNGTGTTFTVTVPSSSNNYYFRVFEYNYNDGMTRYLTDPVNDNPRQCLLETIINPSFSAVRLSTAKLGGQITTDQSGTISERGIYWSDSPGVTASSNNLFEVTDANGAFALDVSELPRSSTIYFIAYVINASGTSYTSESSFTNVPIFTGTNNWENAGSWNVQQVPGSGFTYGDATDNPTINGICTLNSNTAVNDLTINSSRSLTVNPAKSLTVSGTLTNNGGTSGLVIKSTAAGTGQLMHNNAGINATVERYATGLNDGVMSRYHLVSVPINTDMSPLFSEVFLWSYLARYDESLNAWHQMNTPTDNSIYTGLGYLTYDPTDAAETYIFRGELNYDDVPATLTYTASNRGWNLVGNPYPATLDWDAISGKTSMGDAIYLWDQVNRRYATYSSGTGGVNGGTQYVAPGQAFFVRTTAADAALTINNTARTLTASTFLKSSEQSPTDVLHLTAKINNMTDEMLVHFNPNATDLFDGAFDAYKLTSLAGSSVPGIYSVDANGTRYSINSLPFHSPEVAVDVVFSIGVDGVATFTASGLETFAQHTGLSIYLKDTKTNQEISLQTTPEYTFNYLSSDDPKRFKIRFAESLTGVNENKVNTLKCNVYSVDKNVTIQYNDWQGKKGNANIVDAQGRTVKTVLLDGSGSQQIRVPSASGVYLVKLLFSDYTETHKIAIR